jgi:hypothetical protein
VGAPLALCAAAVALSRWWAGGRGGQPAPALTPALTPAPPGVTTAAAAPPIHGPALFIGNFLSAPAELALALPFIRAGEALTGAPPAHLDPAHLSLRTAGGALARGVLAWALTVPFVAVGGAAVLAPVLARVAGGGGGGGEGGGPGMSPPPPPLRVRGEPDVEEGGPASVSGRAPLLPPALARSSRPPASPKGD